MLALFLFLLGVVLSLAGLVAIGPQVRVHQIDANSKAAWLFKVGAILLIAAEILGLVTPLEPVLVTIGLMMGGAILFSAVAIGSHERQQDTFSLKTSLTLQLFGLGVVIVILTFILPT